MPNKAKVVSPIYPHPNPLPKGEGTPASCAGIVLAGGDSRRMGSPKVWLPFGSECMLQRVVRLVSEVIRPVVIAARAGQELPDLPSWTHIVTDRAVDQGPIEGLVNALKYLHEKAEFAFVVGCDTPLLEPKLARRMMELTDGFDAVVPHVDGFDRPLPAVYRTRLLASARDLLAAGSLRLTSLCESVHTRRVTVAELSVVDPSLRSLTNINTPAEYIAALKEAGLPPR